MRKYLIIFACIYVLLVCPVQMVLFKYNVVVYSYIYTSIAAGIAARKFSLDKGRSYEGSEHAILLWISAFIVFVWKLLLVLIGIFFVEYGAVADLLRSLGSDVDGYIRLKPSTPNHPSSVVAVGAFVAICISTSTHLLFLLMVYSKIVMKWWVRADKRCKPS